MVLVQVSLTLSWLLLASIQTNTVLGCLQLNGQDITLPDVSPVFNSSQFEYHGISPSLQFVCSGHVNAWEAYFEREGMYTNITFQVWRPQTTTSGCINTTYTYVLVGTNSFNNQTVDNTLRSQFVPAPNSVIEFQVGDVVSFYAKFGGSELAYFQTNSEASQSLVSYNIETSLTSLEVDGIPTLNINCSFSIPTVRSVPLLTANVTQDQNTTQSHDQTTTDARTGSTTGAGVGRLHSSLIAIIVVIVLLATITLVITIIVFIACLWPKMRLHRRKGRGRDLTTLTVAVHEVHPNPANAYDTPKVLSSSSYEQPSPKHPDLSPSSKQNLEHTYEIPPDPANYAIPSSLPAETEYAFMNPRNTLAKSKDSDHANGGYCEVGALEEKENLGGQQQQVKDDKRCAEPSESYAVPTSTADPEYTFMNPKGTPAGNSKDDVKHCEKISSAGYSIPLLPMEEEYTVMNGTQNSPAKNSDDGDYCEVGPLDKDGKQDSGDKQKSPGH